MFSVRNESGHHENRSVYFTLAFAGMALMAAMVVGVVVLKRRHARSPHQQVRNAVKRRTTRSCLISDVSALIWLGRVVGLHRG